ncbi:MAG: hypothetical protein HY687_02635 [Chloroflexi bacterium]|nr:hypothetical protein [Chloroflexota bacterium]
MTLLEKVWDFLTNIVPVERWVLAIANVLRFLSIAFILLFLVVIALLLREWGFTAEQRLILILVVLGLLALVLVFGVILAMLPGGALYSPYERSLGRGEHYGNDSRPRRRKEAQILPGQTQLPGLPEPPELQERQRGLK